jgi:hypothetical protein
MRRVVDENRRRTEFQFDGIEQPGRGIRRSEIALDRQRPYPVFL